MSAKKSVCFIDTNVIAHWIMSEGGVLNLLVEKYNLNKEFKDIYKERYSDSVTLIEKILDFSERDDLEFLFTNLCLKELFSAIRDELRSIVLFKKGVPISRWRDPRINPEFKKEDYNDVYEILLESFDGLFQNGMIQPIPDIQPEDEKEYWNVYSSLLFLVKESQTQDVIILTTAIFNKGDYFITKDEKLIRSTKKILKDEYDLDIINPKNAIGILFK